MTTAPWPCSRCGTPGVRNIAASAFCGTHLTELFDTFDPSIWAANGVGLPRGLERPEYGPGNADLTCVACGASWVAVPGDPCPFCGRSRELLAEHQRSLLIRPPDIDAKHQSYDTVMMAWGERLKRAVDAGVLTRTQAQAAWRRGVGHAAA